MRRLALITGGSRGIGRQISLQLLQDKVVDGTILVSRSASSEMSPPDLRPLEEERWACDLASQEAVAALCGRIEREPREISVLINAAGISSLGLLASSSKIDAVTTPLQTNLIAPLLVTRSFVRGAMRRDIKAGKTEELQDKRSIVMIGSVLGSVGISGAVVYSAGKAGIAGMTRSLAQELAPSRIRCNAVEPGFVRTDMTKGMDEAAKVSSSKIALGRFARPEEIAHVVSFLASTKASYVTGAVWRVDGGIP